MNKTKFNKQLISIQTSYFGSSEDCTASEDRNELNNYYDQVANIINSDQISNQEKIDWFRQKILSCYENFK